jgi:hypothetical protein
MLRFALAFVLGLFVASSAGAQESRSLLARQPCDSFEKMFDVAHKAGEEMLFTGEGMVWEAMSGNIFTGGMFFFTNQKTGSYTIINVYGDGMACVLQSGTKFEPYGGPQKKRQEESK